MAYKSQTNNGGSGIGHIIQPDTTNLQSMGINRFIENVTEFVRPSLFLVRLNNYGNKYGSNQGITSSSTSFGAGFEFYCSAASIPASEVGAIDVSFMGRTIKVAGSRTFGDWSITVYNDIQYKIRNFFETWSAKINGHDSNVGYNAIRHYYGNASVYQLDQAGNTLSEYKMNGVFPTSVGEISLDWSNGNSVSTFTVNMAIGNFWSSTASEAVDAKYGVNNSQGVSASNA